MKRIHKITKKMKQEFIKEEYTPSEALVALYRWVVPDFDEVEFIDGFPKVSKKFSEELIGLCLGHVNSKQDRSIRHRFLLLWLNKGFSVQEDLKDNTISTYGVKVRYKCGYKKEEKEKN